MKNRIQPERDRQARDIFLRAVEMESAEEQAGYIKGACQHDEALRSRVEALLTSHKQDSFLEAAVVDEAPTTFLANTTAAEEPGTVIGRYKLLQKLGEGGCGVVYMAEQREPVTRRVALKVIKRGMDSDQVIARFEAERQALALMDHPNIAKVLDAGATETGRPYFVMELVRGTRITEYCDESNLSTAGRLDLFIQICQAIQHAHQKGIIHRDIKPSNILVTINDGVAVPKVIDFGIAKATTGQQLTDKTLFTAYEQFIGTPAYMSPEQTVMTSLDIDTRSDIYSLGVLLYELLTGKTPFDAKELLQAGFDEMRRTIREKEPARPSTRLSTMLGGDLTTTAKHRQTDAPKLISILRGDLDWIVMKALEKDRARRYETASGLAMDLKRFLGNETVLARPPSRVYRFQKLVRRNKLAFVAAGAISAALIVGIVVSSWQATVARQSRREAESARLAEKDQRVAAQAEKEKAQVAQAGEAAQRRRAEARENDAQQLLYAANMNLAQQAWELNNIGRVRQLLDETANYPHRGFEWFFWQQQTHLEQKTLRGHIGPVRTVAFSPDGRLIVTGSDDHTAKIWDVASGRLLSSLLGHSAAIRSVAFSPDGHRILTGSSDQTARIWDVASGQPLRTFKGHRAEVRCAAFSPDAQQIVTGSADWTAKGWDANSGTCLFTLLGHGAAVIGAAFSADGQTVATAGVDGAKLWHLPDGTAIPLSNDAVRDVNSAIPPSLTEQNARFWGKTNPDATPDTDSMGRVGGGVECVAFSADRRRVVTGSWDNSARVWDMASGRLVQMLTGHSHVIRGVAFSADGNRIGTASDDQRAKVWETDSGKELLTLHGHTISSASVAFSPDGQRIVTGSWDGRVKVWELADAQQPRTFPDHWGTSLSSDGKRILTGGPDGTVSILDSASGEELHTFGDRGSELWCVTFSPDGQRVASGYQNAPTCVWEAATGKLLFKLESETNGVHSVAFSPDGKWIATTGHGRDAWIWDAATGKERRTFQGHSGMVSYAAFSPDSQRLLTGGFDGTARVRELSTGKPMLVLDGGAQEWNAAAFSHDARQILTGCGLIATLYDADTGKPIQRFHGHNGAIDSVGFSPDGQRVITGSQRDGTVRIWDPASGRALLTLGNERGPSRHGAFSPDGQEILTMGNEGTELWQTATAEQVVAWHRQDQEGDARIQSLRTEAAAAAARESFLIAHDPAALTNWLVLAPLAMERKTEGAAVRALDQEQIPAEGQLRPRVGDQAGICEKRQVWVRANLDSCLLDFNALLGGTEIWWSIAYAVCYLQCPNDLHDLLMMVDSDDQSKVYLNGAEIYRYASGGRGVDIGDPSDVVAGVELKAGINVLVFKVVQKEGGWKGLIRFTQADHSPVRGIKVTLDPEGKNPQ